MTENDYFKPCLVFIKTSPSNIGQLHDLHDPQKKN